MANRFNFRFDFRLCRIKIKSRWPSENTLDGLSAKQTDAALPSLPECKLIRHQSESKNSETKNMGLTIVSPIMNPI